MAFDPDKYLAETPDFDPDAYLAEDTEERKKDAIAEAESYGAAIPEIPASPAAEPSQLEALGRGAVQGATLGFGEEIGSAALSPFDYIRQLLPGSPESVEEKLKAQGFGGLEGQQNIVEKYRQLRDTARQADVAAEEAHPGTYLAGEIVGGVAPAIGTGGAGALAQAGKTGLKVAAKEGAKAGMKYGAAEALGRTEADLTKGEFAEAAKDVAFGTAAGGALGGVVPVGIAKGKKIAKAATKLPTDISNWVYDKSPRMFKKIIAATSVGRTGKEVTGGVVEQTQLKRLENLAELTQDFLEESRQQANKLIGESLDPNVKINVTDQYGKWVDDLSNNLKKFAPDSDEAKQIKNAIQTINSQRQEILGSAMADPNLPTKKEAYEKLLKKMEVINFQNEIGVPQAKAIDSLFDRAAKLKGKWNPDSLDARKIMADFNLGDTDTAIEMAKEIAELNIKRPKINPKTGEITEVPEKLTALIKKYSPEIKERGDTVYLQRGPGRVRESEILKTRPEQVQAPLEVTPEQLRSVEASLKEISRTSDPGGVIYKSAKEMRNLLEESLPADLADKFRQGMATQSEINRIKDLIDKDVISKFGGAEKTQAQQALSNLLESQHGFGGATPAQTRLIREDIQDTISRLDPQVGQYFAEEAADAAKRVDLNRVGDAAGLNNFSLLGGAVEAAGVRAGAGIGRYVFRPLDHIATLGKESLEKMANQVSTTSPKLSNFLGNLANVESESRRKALLFSASQKPDLKADLEALYNMDEEEEN